MAMPCAAPCLTDLEAVTEATPTRQQPFFLGRRSQTSSAPSKDLCYFCIQFLRHPLRCTVHMWRREEFLTSAGQVLVYLDLAAALQETRGRRRGGVGQVASRFQKPRSCISVRELN